MALKRLLKKGLALWDEFAAVDAETYASSMAYFTFLALVPSFALCIAYVSNTGISEQDVLELMARIIPDALEDLATALVGDAFDRSGVAFSLSSVTLIWTASRGIKALRNGLNATYDVKETRSPLAVIIISIVAALALGAMTAGSLYLAFSDCVVDLLTRIAPDIQLPGALTSAVTPLLLLIYNVLMLDFGYAFLPAGFRRLKTQLFGALFASVGIAVLSFGFRIYVDFFGNYTLLYGSIATVALLLIWIYLVSFVLLVGGFLNRVRAEGKLKL